MARRIVEAWKLAVLNVHLDLSERTPAVATELIGYRDGRAQTMWTRRHPLSTFGLDATPITALSVPSDLRDAVVHSLVTDLRREAALWLRLVPPYGYLGAVPWEASLISATNLPLLRVPDRLPVASDLGRIWRAVIAVSATPGSKWAAPYVRSLTRKLQETVPAAVEVDVFADVGTVAALTKDGTLELGLRVHNPADAQPAAHRRAAARPDTNSTSKRIAGYAGPPSGQIWADWIAAGLGGQAVRALHVVLDGAFDLDRPMLAVAPDPERPTPRKQCAVITGNAVLALTDAIGSAALSFGSPARNPADLATRMIADSVGQQRAGATIYSSLALDPDGTELAKAHAFVVDRDGYVETPRHPSLFAYLQPEHMQNALRQPWPEEATDQTVPGQGEDSGLEVYFQGSESVPAWVASSDHFLGNQWAGLAKQASAAAPTAEIKGAYNKGAAEALSQLRDIVDRHARS